MDNILAQLLSFPPHPPPASPLPDADVDKRLRGVLKLLNETPAKKLTAGLTGGGGGDLLDVGAFPYQHLIRSDEPSMLELGSPTDFLQILDPSINTLPYLYVLLAHISSTQGGKQAAGSQDSALLPGGRLWGPMVHFMEHFDPIQIRYAGNEFSRLINLVEAAANKASLVCRYR